MFDRTVNQILSHIDETEIGDRIKYLMADLLAESVVKELDAREAHIIEMRAINDRMYEQWVEEHDARLALESEVERLKAEVIRLMDELNREWSERVM